MANDAETRSVLETHADDDPGPRPPFVADGPAGFAARVRGLDSAN